MRGLTAKQKREIKKWFDANYDGGYMFDMADKIDSDTYIRIHQLNPTEIHYQNVNHYLEELVNNQ